MIVVYFNEIIHIKSSHIVQDILLKSEEQCLLLLLKDPV